MRKIASIIILSALVSCAENKIDETESKSIEYKKPSKMRVVKLAEKQTADSLSIISMLQSDMDVKMLRNISIVDEKYRLGISLEVALELGVTEEIYNKYQTLIENLND